MNENPYLDLTPRPSKHYHEHSCVHQLAETIVRQKSATINNYFNQSQTDKSVQGAEINKT
jgi:hypothetical protein